MSTKLYWKPVTENPDRVFGYELKFHLAPEFFGHDGSLRSQEPEVFDSSHIGFLKGVSSAGSVKVKQEAEKLISLIEKYGSVEVWIDE